MDASGKDFEQVVECLSKCLHRHAIITPNDKIVDVNTHRKRQIDISIRMNDGPTRFLAMVEVRDRSRRVGVDFIEQIKSKRDAIQADKAIIVSKKGFAGTAVETARAYNIETYSFAEALKKDWTQMFASFSGFFVCSYPANATIFFLDDSMSIIDLREDLLSRIAAGDQDTEIICDQNGSPKMRVSEFLQRIINDPRVRTKADSDPQKKHSVRIIVPVEGEGMYVRRQDDTLIRVRQVIIVGHIWREMKTYEPVVRQYKDEKTGEVIAEVVGSNDPAFELEIIAEYPGRTDIERRVFMRRKGRAPTLPSQKRGRGATPDT